MVVNCISLACIPRSGIRFSVENLESKQVCWLVPVTSAFGRQRRVDYQFQAL